MTVKRELFSDQKGWGTLQDVLRYLKNSEGRCMNIMTRMKNWNFRDLLSSSSVKSGSLK